MLTRLRLDREEEDDDMEEDGDLTGVRVPTCLARTLFLFFSISDGLRRGSGRDRLTKWSGWLEEGVRVTTAVKAPRPSQECPWPWRSSGEKR